MQQALPTGAIRALPEGFLEVIPDESYDEELRSGPFCSFLPGRDPLREQAEEPGVALSAPVGNDGDEESLDEESTALIERFASEVRKASRVMLVTARCGDTNLLIHQKPIEFLDRIPDESYLEEVRSNAFCAAFRDHDWQVDRPVKEVVRGRNAESLEIDMSKSGGEGDDIDEETFEYVKNFMAEVEKANKVRLVCTTSKDREVLFGKEDEVEEELPE